MRTKILFWFSMLWILATAILLTIYLMWLFYPIEITWLGLEEKVYLSAKTIQHNFNQLMNYLTNPFQGELLMPDFRSSKDGLHHFRVVKYLFHLVQLIFILTLPAVYACWKRVIQRGYLSVFSSSILICFFTPILLAFIALGIGFDHFFTLFHQVLFVGDQTWLFDPAKDPVIWILPKSFFRHAFILFFVLYEIMMGSLYYMSRKFFRIRKDKLQ